MDSTTYSQVMKRVVYHRNRRERVRRYIGEPYIASVFLRLRKPSIEQKGILYTPECGLEILSVAERRKTHWRIRSRHFKFSREAVLDFLHSGINPKETDTVSLKQVEYGADETSRIGTAILRGNETDMTTYLSSLRLDKSVIRELGIEMLALGKYIDSVSEEI